MAHVKMFLAILIATLFATDACGETKVPGADTQRLVELKMGYDFSAPKGVDKIKFIIVLPLTIANTQRILDIDYSVKPYRTFSAASNMYAEFLFNRPAARFAVNITVRAQLLRNGLATAMRSTTANPSTGSSGGQFTGKEKYLEKDLPEVQRIAQSITGPDDVKIVKAIYDYLAKNMDYGIYTKQHLGLAKFIKYKTGDCSEYADLFVTLCRAKEIPARVITGFLTEFDDTPRHTWAEVYLKQYGWVPFDPTLAAAKDLWLRSMNYYSLKPNYIYLSHIRNDAVIGNSHYCAWWSWGGEVTVKDTVQIRPLPLAGRSGQGRSASKPVQTTKKTSAKPSQAPTLGQVQSIAYGKRSSVVIEGRIRYEQDSIHGVKVVRIDLESVRFEKDGKYWTQAVGEKPGPGWK